MSHNSAPKKKEELEYPQIIAPVLNKDARMESINEQVRARDHLIYQDYNVPAANDNDLDAARKEELRQELSRPDELPHDVAQKDWERMKQSIKNQQNTTAPVTPKRRWWQFF